MLYFLQLFISLSLSGLEATFAYFAAATAGLDAVSLGYIFIIMGLASAAVQGSMGKLTKNMGKPLSFKQVLSCQRLGFGLISFTQDFTRRYFSLLFSVSVTVLSGQVCPYY
ncbi:hypothetical protein [Lentibacillus sp. CBA3610]|uniref:hypothetical protein n=1 Tax=Lentibacillus sp. CBA3610 TaxID=2518176 RepID=UPI00350E38B0